MEEQLLLKLTDIYMRHGPEWILKGFNLKIRKGIIYSLLGPSGAGKTTIFGIILRQILPQFGKIETNGVDTRKDFGYMPQKLSLFDDLTVEESLIFYSYILGFDGKIPEKTFDLLQMLEIRCFNSMISTLSGGEKRRISYSIALMREAKFLLLDEPTASLDCLHSQTIWNHLMSLAKNGTTVLLTTHYVQEAAHSTMVGFLRKGTLIEEGTPSELVEKYSTNDLEGIFLSLSTLQDQDETDLQESSSKIKFEPKTGFSGDKIFKASSFKAQMLKNYIWLKRNFFVVLAHLCVPIFFALFYGVSYGNDPIGFKIAILSQTKSNDCFNQTTSYSEYIRCDLPLHLECFIYSRLEKKFDLVHYENLTQAESDLNMTKVRGILIFDSNFTSSLTKFYGDVTYFENDLVQSAIVLSSVDNHDYIMYYFMKGEIASSIYGVFEDIESHCNTSKRAKLLPITFEDAVYGDKDDKTYSHTAYPAYLCAISFGYTIIFTSPVMLTEKKEGFFLRNTIAGLTYLEMITAHMIVQTIIMIIQDVLFILLLILPFGYPLVGNFFTALSIMICCNLTGASIVLLICEMFNDELMILMSSVAAMNSSTLLGGVLWPTASFPYWLQLMIHVFPTAKMSDSMTAVTIKGLGPTNIEVYKSYIECSAWILLSIVLCNYFFKKNKANFS